MLAQKQENILVFIHFTKFLLSEYTSEDTIFSMEKLKKVTLNCLKSSAIMLPLPTFAHLYVCLTQLPCIYSKEVFKENICRY